MKHGMLSWAGLAVTRIVCFAAFATRLASCLMARSSCTAEHAAISLIGREHFTGSCVYGAELERPETQPVFVSSHRSPRVAHTRSSISAADVIDSN